MNNEMGSSCASQACGTTPLCIARDDGRIGVNGQIEETVTGVLERFQGSEERLPFVR